MNIMDGDGMKAHTVLFKKDLEQQVLDYSQLAF